MYIASLRGLDERACSQSDWRREAGCDYIAVLRRQMSPMSPSSRVFSFFALLLLCLSLLACGKPQPVERTELVVSVRPLALIAREIAGDNLPVHVLIQGADPHHYAPSVSDRARLERSLLMIWLGPQMEGLLAGQVNSLSEERQLQLLGATEYEYQGANATDPHLWLRPRNAALAGALIAERLAQLQPQQAELYRSRARDFSQSMASLQKVLDRALWAYRDVPIVVTHDAYGHFFGSAGVETRALGNSSGGGHGARAMLDLSGVGRGCLFGEVPENTRDRQLAEHLGLEYAALDPLGEQLGPDARYLDLIESLLAQARGCLSEISDQADQSEQ
ncbi:metal ABC transporter substrate-binding protein [Microbulbifer sp. THAF38]|uniref:metal ABC transporter substrate-binding protein n=1 Tax=Microbulbifer sp. THAF38 TaxID=2587856 RepID=UPI0012AA5A45|nr:metal ABC transporter substrate-binding protein [Microbulbifer sp. THAF38]QFT53017.1 High-affinity zinc uptake system protein ZnuA precursor [Microbulbifer sp. THAF38]